MTAIMDEKDERQDAARKRGTTRILAVSALIALLLAVFAVSALAINGHVHSEYKKRDDIYAALAIKTDRNMKNEQAAHQLELTTKLASADTVAKKKLKHEVSKQKNHDVRVLRRVVRHWKSKLKREADAARAAGYSSGYGSGNSAGYSSGKDDGYTDGSRDAYTFCYFDDGYYC